MRTDDGYLVVKGGSESYVRGRNKELQYHACMQNTNLDWPFDSMWGSHPMSANGAEFRISIVMTLFRTEFQA